MTISLDDGAIDMEKVRTDFDIAYKRQYGHNSPDNRVEMANIRLAALGELDRPANAPPVKQKAQATRERAVYFGGQSMPTAIVDRHSMAAGGKLDGPAIIEETTTTTLLPPGWSAALLDGDHLSLTRGSIL